jgi:predicted nucleotidyltransferase
MVDAHVSAAILQELRTVGAATPGLRLLALHGSRARGEAHARSDWDFACLGDLGFDLGRLHLALATALGTDAVDLADLAAASGVLRYHVARDGVLVWADDVETWHAFRLQAIDFWCDYGAILRQAQGWLLDDIAARAATADLAAPAPEEAT